MPLLINLPPLHQGQLDIDASPARFKCVVCGRRYGKTKYGVHKCIRAAIDDPGIYWWVAPTYKLALEGWEVLKELAFQIPEVEVHEADRYIRLPNGATIWCMSSSDEGALRGRGLKGVVLDEFAQMRESTWFLELRPALADYKGWALFIGTPQGKNWAYRLFQKAQSLPDWDTFQKPTHDNPYISRDELQEMKDEMPELQYAQEVLADFGASQYLVYPDFSREMHKWTQPVPEFVGFYGGLDFGGTSISSHKSTGMLAGRTKDDIIIFLNEFSQAGPNIMERQLEWIGEQESLVRILRNRTGNQDYSIHWRGDKTQMTGIQMMRNAGINIWPSKGGPDSVNSGIAMVQRRLKLRGDGKFRFYYMPHLHFLPEAMERYRYPEPYNDEYHMESKNPLKVMDDEVDAIRYLIEGIDRAVIGDPMQLYKGQLAELSSGKEKLSWR